MRWSGDMLKVLAKYPFLRFICSGGSYYAMVYSNLKLRTSKDVGKTPVHRPSACSSRPRCAVIYKTTQQRHVYKVWQEKPLQRHPPYTFPATHVTAHHTIAQRTSQESRPDKVSIAPKKPGYQIQVYLCPQHPCKPEIRHVSNMRS